MNMKRKDYFNIPNMMGYFRIIMIPVFITLYLRADSVREYYLALGALCLSLITDFFDGKIARHFDMITPFGKILDPVADKLTQFAIIFVLLFQHTLMLPFMILFVIKELYMGLMGLYLLKKEIVYGAKWYGKACTMIVDLGCVLLLLLPEMKQLYANMTIWVLIIFALFSLGMYIRFHISLLSHKVSSH